MMIYAMIYDLIIKKTHTGGGFLSALLKNSQKEGRSKLYKN